jgi:hypothetical protein
VQPPPGVCPTGLGALAALQPACPAATDLLPPHHDSCCCCRLALAYQRQAWFEPPIEPIDAIKRAQLDGYAFRQLPRFIDEQHGEVDLVQSMVRPGGRSSERGARGGGRGRASVGRASGLPTGRLPTRIRLRAALPGLGAACVLLRPGATTAPRSRPAPLLPPPRRRRFCATSGASLVGASSSSSPRHMLGWCSTLPPAPILHAPRAPGAPQSSPLLLVARKLARGLGPP